MPTLEVAEALSEVAKAERCVADCQRDLDRARRTREQALLRQGQLEREKAGIEVALHPGQQRLGPRMAREPTPGEVERLRRRLEELTAILSGGPEPRRGRLY